MRRRKLIYVLEKCFICGGILEGEVVFQSGGVQLLFKRGVNKEGFYLRAEHKCAVHICIIEGLYAEKVPCAEKLLLFLVPDNECEHSSELIEKLFAVFLIAVDKSFRIGICSEFMPLCLKITADLTVVVDLAVEHQHH